MTETYDSTLPRVYTIVYPVSKLSKEEAQALLRHLLSRARHYNDLSIVLGVNGKRGRQATGNYSLIARAIGCGRQQIAKVMSGRSQSLPALREISRVTGLTIDEVLSFIDARREERHRQRGLDSLSNSAR